MYSSPTQFCDRLAYLGSWVINEAWEGLSVDGKQIFGGFKEILQK